MSAYRQNQLSETKIEHTIPIVRVNAIIRDGETLTVNHEVRLNLARDTTTKIPLTVSLTAIDSVTNQSYTCNVRRPLRYHPDIAALNSTDAWFVSATLTLKDGPTIPLTVEHFTAVSRAIATTHRFSDEVELDLSRTDLQGRIRGDLTLTVRSLESLMGGHDPTLDIIVIPKYYYKNTINVGPPVSDGSAWQTFSSDVLPRTLVHEFGHSIGLAWSEPSGLDKPTTFVEWGGAHCGRGLSEQEVKNINDNLTWTKDQHYNSFRKIECIMSPDDTNEQNTSQTADGSSTIATAATALCTTCQAILRKADRSAGWPRARIEALRQP